LHANPEPTRERPAQRLARETRYLPDDL
jgi:hypothetical protein